MRSDDEILGYILRAKQDKAERQRLDQLDDPNINDPKLNDPKLNDPKPNDPRLGAS